ncbi:MAG: hypothetical protein HFG05_02840 [Oscillibacter sp.]|nr:hypothetical protein [Oscillibacter sp.]
MKKKHPVLGAVCLAILICGGLYTFRAVGAKAEITIGEKTYEMLTMTVGEFMGDGYLLSTMSTEGKSLYTYNYSGAMMEAKTYYNTAVPFRPKDGYGAPLSCWLYNPTAEQVEIREGKICAISCKVAQMRECGLPVFIAGLELNSQSKEELKAYMDGELRSYQFSENEDVNAISYTKGRVSYTFSFDEEDTLLNAIARNNV